MIASTLCGFILLIAISLHSICCRGELLHSRGSITANFGQRTVVKKSELQIQPKTATSSCLVKVINKDTNLYESTGRLFPPTFPCDFSQGTVYYEHFGLPMHKHTTVELLVTYASNSSEKMSTPVFVKVNIVVLTAKNIVEKNLGLTVKNFNGYSDHISRSNLGFSYERDAQLCSVSLRNGASTNSWPR